MKIIPKLQEGNVIRQDNTRVATKPIIKPTEYRPAEYYIRDLGGQPSTDTRTSSERNRDYWHPIKGAKERFKSSMSNKTNPLVGLENTVMPAMAGAALVTTPATLIGGTIGSEAVNNATGGFGKWLEGKTGIPSEIGEYLNPGAIYGGAKGYNITKNKLASKFIKGDADLGWSPLINTKRFKYYKDIPIRKGSHYRVVTGQEPINDAITSGVIRTKAGNKAHSSGKVNTSKIKLKPKTVTYDAPYFQKEKLYYSPNSRDKVIVGNDINTPFRKIGLKNNIEQYPIGTPIIEGDITSPYINGKFGVAPSKDFTYFDRGLFGWREKTFDNNNGLINKNHWIFNKEARTPTNITMAAANRVMPFLSNMEKTPARIAAYKVGRRTKGNASVSLKDIKNNESTYTGSATPEGNNGDRDLLGMYLFQNDPLISKSPWFQKVAQSFKPAKGKGFSYSDRYSKLYPGIEQRRYQMQSVVKDSRPLRFRDIEEFNEYSSGIGKLQGKEGDMVIEMPDGFQTFRQPGTNYAGPIDDVGGHIIKIDYNNKGKLTQISQDMWKFNPRDYAKRWSGSSASEGVRATKQAALMDKVGTPFILQQENPIVIGGRRVWESLEQVPRILRERRQPRMQGALLTMKKGGLIPRCQAGATIKDTAIGMIPIVGTYQDYKKFRDNPTWGNFGWLAASALGDALFFTGAGAALKGVKAARVAAKSRALLTANRYGRSRVGFQRGLEYGASKGDVKSMFQNLRNYKVAEQKQLAAEAAARQQTINGAKNIGKDLGQDAIVNTTQDIVSKRKGGSLVSDGRRFKFKDSPLARNSKTLNNKRDMRKKFMKSDRPTYTNNRIRKGQEGLRFVNYDEVKNPELNFNDYKLPVDTFSPYNIPVKSNGTEPIRERIVEKIVEVPVEVTKQEEKEEVKVPWTNQYKNNKQQWITDLTNAYRNAGITNEDTLNMLISQDALESGWGRSAQGDYNFGNITAGKYWKGRTVTGGDHNAKGQKISQVFRAYDSINDYAKDKVDFLKRLYDFTEGDTIDVFANKLQGGNRGKRKYAEAPNYVEMLKKVYRGGK